jgi:tyrosyl-tRNA synthetase
MSKSLGNYVGITESPSEMFGKVMSISDDLMWRYYELLTDLSVEEIASLKRAAEKGDRNPRDIKAELARLIITDFHSDAAARLAEEEFVRRFRNKEIPEEVEERTIRANECGDLPSLLATVGLAGSKAEARRLIEQGGVSVDGVRQALTGSADSWEAGKTVLLKVGKRRFVRVRFI